MNDLTIGALARGAGVGVETVRYYQRRGLMPEPARRPGQIRRYDDNALERLRFIRAAKSLGFSLDDVEALLRFETAGTCDDVKHLVRARARSVAHQIERLQETRAVLADVLRQCERSDGRVRCPLIASLEKQSSGRR